MEKFKPLIKRKKRTQVNMPAKKAEDPILAGLFEKLKNIKAEKNVSYELIGYKLGVSWYTVWRWLNKPPTRIHVAQKMALETFIQKHES